MSTAFARLLFCLCTAVLAGIMPADAFCAPADAGQAPVQMPAPRPDADRALRLLIPASQAVVPPLITQDRQALAPYLEYWLDAGEFADVSDVVRQHQEHFQIFNPTRMALTDSGVVWLRFVLQAAQPGSESPQLLLDLGPSIPGQPVLFTPGIGTDGNVEWQETRPSGGRVLLPEPAAVPLVCYLRVDGVPGLWFSPQVMTVNSALAAAPAPDWHLAALAALAAVFVMCLLKGLVEPGQWSLWTLLFLAAAMGQAWGGQPPLLAADTARTLAGTCCGGVALMLWPHVGRHLLHSHSVSRGLDASLILLCLPGAALALAPLVPHLEWTTRWVNLWPVCMVLFLPSALWGCLAGARASAAYLLGTLIPPLACAAALLGLRSPFDPALLDTLPLLGVALGCIAPLSLARAQRADAEAPLAAAAPAAHMSRNLSEEQPMDLGAPVAEESVTGLYSAWTSPLSRLVDAAAANTTENLPEDCRARVTRLVAEAGELRSELERLEARAEEEKRIAARCNVVIVSADEGFAAVLGHVLRREDCHIRRAASLEEAVTLGRAIPARMYVFQGGFADVSSGPTLQTLKTLRTASGHNPVFLAYTPDESGWRELARAGFTHALVLPIDDAALISTIRELKEERPDAPGPEAVVEEIPDLFGTEPDPKPQPAQKPAPRQQPAAVRPAGTVTLGEPLPDMEAGADASALSSAERGGIIVLLAQAGTAVQSGDLQGVQDIAAKLTAKCAADAALTRFADLLGRAAAARDTAAVRDLLAETAAAVERRAASRHD